MCRNWLTDARFLTVEQGLRGALPLLTMWAIRNWGLLLHKLGRQGIWSCLRWKSVRMYRQLLQESKGVVRTTALHDAGMTDYQIRKAINGGELIRLKRGWIAAPDAEEALKYAARNALTITCVSQATRLGLWVREPDPRHFAVPRPGREVRAEGDRVHYCRAVEARPKFALEDTVANVLATVAHCQPKEEAIAVWDSALNKRLVVRGYLESLPLSKRAQQVLAGTSQFADSGLETYFRVRMRWLRVPIRTQTWLIGKRVDFLMGERLVVQIDGSTHVGPQRDADNAHDAALASAGYTVLRFGYTQIIHEWPAVQEAVMRAINAGCHNRR